MMDEHNQGQRIPTSERLAQALEAAHAPQRMIDAARAGYYDDYKSPLGAPIMTLAKDASKAGLVAIYNRAIDGDFDAEGWEAEEWARIMGANNKDY